MKHLLTSLALITLGVVARGVHEFHVGAASWSKKANAVAPAKTTAPVAKDSARTTPFVPSVDFATPCDRSSVDGGSAINPATDVDALIAARSLIDDAAQLRSFLGRADDSPSAQRILYHATGELVAAGDYVTAVRAATRINDAATRIDRLETIAYAWATADSVAALEWISTCDDEALRQRLLTVAAKSFALTDSDLAIEWLGAGRLLTSDSVKTLVSSWQPGAAPPEELVAADPGDPGFH